MTVDKKSTLLVILVLCMLVSCSVEQNPLHFKTDHTFKIAQFTDIHFHHDSDEGQQSLMMIGRILDQEKPDLVVLTGDIVTEEPVEAGWKAILAPMIERAIPWAVTLGNHDDEENMTRGQIIDLLKAMPHSLVQPGPLATGGGGNYVLQIKSSNDPKTAALIYCLDSNAYSQIESIDSYAWFTSEQIGWYREQSNKFTAANSGQPVPALAFFHIPLPEYRTVWQNSSSACIGQKAEEVCAPIINSGMFSAMLESGDVMATFVGHDHVNDYAGVLYGICLAYGRASGYDSYGDLEKGARIIELREGEREFKSWIRTGSGEVVNSFVYPETFTKLVATEQAEK